MKTLYRRQRGFFYEQQILVTSYECDPMTCSEEFLLSKCKYEHITGRHPKNDIIAYQIRQSFTPGKISNFIKEIPEHSKEIQFLVDKIIFIIFLGEIHFPEDFKDCLD